MTDYNRHSGAETPLAKRRSGETGRRAGLKSQRDNDDNAPGAAETADSSAGADRLAALLVSDPELAEVVSVWKVLDEPIRAAILALIRSKQPRT